MEKKFMNRALELARAGMKKNQGGPFGCVIVKNGSIIAEGNNRVTSDHDPTAHAEIIAIRNACRILNSFQLNDCEIYTSCEPCPMCLGAIYWARPKRVYYAANREDAAKAGFDDDFIYKELDLSPEERRIPMIQTERKKAIDLFKEWDLKEDKTQY
ncbi:nucleoside deaminase [Rhodohalobacter sp. 614A]|uniref:nucleoside deaminase n=1 Tax=Rhodohalobacter sp. 614A TaxID=2908649 RepID=UPI00272AA944|nr:nucleoside deaminase [Rhodohalobacter sp. 614A]